MKAVAALSSFEIATGFLGKQVTVKIDRQLGSKHPWHGFIYEANYGYIPDTKASDGEELDVYFLGVDQSIDEGLGTCVAIVHRLDDDDDKLVVTPPGIELTNEQIEQAVKFREQWFKHKVIRAEKREYPLVEEIN